MSKKNRRALPGSLDVAGSPEDERLPVGRSFMYGLQHVLTMYGGIIAPPIILGGAAGVTDAEKGLLIASCLFIGGLATILQSGGSRSSDRSSRSCRARRSRPSRRCSRS